MTRMLALVALAAALLSGPLPPTAANAADGRAMIRARTQPLPFPRDDRARSVWASRACWTECGSYCAWDEAACLSTDAQGQCLKRADNCDRSCQRACRTSGGPLLPLDF